MDVQALFLYLVAGILFAATVIEILVRSSVKRLASRFFLYSACIAFAYLIYIGFLQFKAFQGGVLSSVLGTGIGFKWFLSYVQLHFWNQYVVSFIAAILFLLVSYYFNKKYEGRFFEQEERYLAATGIFLVGYPLWLFYIVIVLVLSTFASALFVKKGERLPLYHFWIPVALGLFVAVHFFLIKIPWWSSFMSSFRF